MSFVESLETRGLTSDKWVYYCGDHEVPPELVLSGYTVYSHKELLIESDLAPFLTDRNVTERRDLWALVDFFVCRNSDIFIGNSVSTFSALQILIRNGNGAYWYNSGSIPLSTILQAYSVPLVYTYTELSAASGQFMLKASILSARNLMPLNPVHVLYNGKNDTDFLTWLGSNNVTVHAHDPVWRADVEIMRKNGDPAVSHLFLHEVCALSLFLVAVLSTRTHHWLFLNFRAITSGLGRELTSRFSSTLNTAC